VIAAEGGAAHLDRLGRRPNRLIGDLDSADPALVERLAAAGVAIDPHAADKDATDMELALLAAAGAGAAEIVVLGALGGRRLDHELANLLLLADPALADRDVRLVRGASTVRVLPAGGRAELAGVAGDLVSLLPVAGDAEGVTTEGLHWPLERATLRLGRSRGVSNEIVTAPAAIRLERGTLLVVETSTQGAMRR
jgi:thiamine pyrophosphokinase